MKLAYIVSRFPSLTETFVLREVLCLEAMGWPVELYALRQMRPSTVHSAAARIARRAHFGDSAHTMARGVRLLAAHSAYLGSALKLILEGYRKSPRAMAKALLALTAAAAWAEQMHADGIEHVHAHFGSYPALAAMVAAELQGIGFSFTVHAHDLFADNQLLTEKARRAQFVVTISEFNRERLTCLLGSHSVRQLQVIHCGVDLEQFVFTPRQSAQRLCRLLCVAALREYKGLEHLIEACRLLRDAAPDVAFLCEIVGEGPLRHALERQIQRSGLSHVVRLAGARDEAGVRWLLERSDIFVLPSIVARNGYMDGIPVALMEAMAAGVPVVASQLSGIPELVRNNATGVLVPPADAHALCGALLKTMSEPELAMQRARQARVLVEREYDLRRTTRQLAELFLAHGQ